METISFDDFKKVEIKIGKIISAERVEGSDKLLKLQVDFGLGAPKPEEAKAEDNLPQGEPASAEAPARQVRQTCLRRQVIAGIGKGYEPESLIGKLCPFVYNLEPKSLKGLESQGMILCPSGENGPVLLHPDNEVEPGSLVK